VENQPENPDFRKDRTATNENVWRFGHKTRIFEEIAPQVTRDLPPNPSQKSKFRGAETMRLLRSRPCAENGFSQRKMTPEHRKNKGVSCPPKNRDLVAEKRVRKRGKIDRKI